MLCEVKTVFSGGYLPDQDIHISMRDLSLCDAGIFENEIDLRKINECLGDAVRKLSAQVRDVLGIEFCHFSLPFFLTSSLTSCPIRERWTSALRTSVEF
jgi:hypothetical protein